MKLVSSDSCFNKSCCVSNVFFFWISFLPEENCPPTKCLESNYWGLRDQKPCFWSESIRAWELSKFHDSRCVSCWSQMSWKLPPHLPWQFFLGVCTNFGLTSQKTAATWKLHPGSLHHEIPMFCLTKPVEQICSKNHPKLIKANPTKIEARSKRQSSVVSRF